VFVGVTCGDDNPWLLDEEEELVEVREEVTPSSALPPIAMGC